MRPSRSLVRAGGGPLRNNLDQRIRRSSLDRDRSFSTSARISASLALFMGGLGCSKLEHASRSRAGSGLTRTGDHAALRAALRFPLSGLTTRYTRSPSSFSETRVRPSFLRIAPEKKPRTECCCHPVCFMTAAIVVPCGRLNSATTLACLEPARDRGDLSRPLSRGLAGAVVDLRRLTEGAGGFLVASSAPS